MNDVDAKFRQVTEDDRLLALERLLSLHAEETRTRFDIAQEKQDRSIAMLSEIATQLAELSRSDERQWHAIQDLERRVAALEAVPPPRARTVSKRRRPAGRK